MEYNDLLEAHLKYGTTKENIIKKENYEEILTNVVIAPFWSHKMFINENIKIKQINNIVYNIYGKDFEFSFIELKQVGAPAIIDNVLALGVTKCENLLFIGSVGSLDKNIKIGDIVIPEYSICGDGASRYLNKDLKDELGVKEYPNKELSDLLLNITSKYNIQCHYVPNYSIDTIFAQFYHIDNILKYGAKVIEMETALVFKSALVAGIKASALFCVSDNTIIKKSLYSGRTDEENNYRHKVRNEIIPKIIIETIRQIEKN